MRKGTIKAAVLAAVFIGAVLIFGRFMNDTNEDLTTEMKEATLPVITMYQGDQELNELHGYVTEMDAAYMRDTITPVGEDRASLMSWGSTMLSSSSPWSCNSI